MWKTVFGIGGFFAGAGLAGAFVQFTPIWVLMLAGLLTGTLGVLIGIALDKRAVTRAVVLGLLGFLLGAPFGGFLIWYFASLQDTFSGGGLAGIFVGVPLGALLGSAIGIWAGTRRKTERIEAEPDAPAVDGRDAGS